MKKIIRIITINVIVISMFASAPIVYAANTSRYQAIKDTVDNSRGSLLKDAYSGNINKAIPDAYAEYGFGTVKDTSKVFYGGSTGGSNPEKNYWKNQLGTGDATYKGMYTTNRTVSKPNKTYWACYPNAGEYNGKKIDVKGEVVDYKLQNDSHAVISFARGVSCTVLGIHWVQVKWSFHVSNGRCTGAATTVKGNTTYWDVDNQQGVMFWDSSLKGVYLTHTSSKKNQLKYKSASWKSNGSTHSKPFIYAPSKDDNTIDNNTQYAFTEIFEGSSITRVYSFYEGDGSSNGGIGHSNVATVCVPKSCPNTSCGCKTGKTCWH